MLVFVSISEISGEIKAPPKSGDWINKNIEKMMCRVMSEARHMRPLPTAITMHSIARRKFIEILQSKSAYFPDQNGQFKFITIPVYENNRMPYGTFSVEWFKKVNLVK